MNHESPHTLFAKVQARRQLVVEVLVTAVGLSLYINIFSSCLMNAMSESGDTRRFWLWLTFILGAFLVLGLCAVCFVLLRKKEHLLSSIGLTLALRVDPEGERVEIIPLEGYAPATYGNELFSRVGGSLNRDFLQAWRGPNPTRHPDFGPSDFCWSSLANLAEALVVLQLHRFGKSTLTPSAQFHGEFRKFTGTIGQHRLPVKDWPLRVEQNEFLSARGIKNLYLPTTGQFKASKTHRKKGGKEHPRYLQLATDYGTLSISIAPDWTILGDRNRTREAFGLSEVDARGVDFLRVPIDLDLGFQPSYWREWRSRSSAQKITDHYEWLSSLYENIQRRMDWGAYLRRTRRAADDA